jgi:hypothetical protein
VVCFWVQARNKRFNCSTQELLVQNKIFGLWVAQLLISREEHTNSHIYTELLLFGQSHNLFAPLFQDFFVLIFALFDIPLDYVLLLFLGVQEHR